MYDPGFLLVDVFRECLTAKKGGLGLEVEGGVESNTDTGFDFGLGGGGDDLRGLPVEEAEFVGGAVGAPGVEAEAGV